MAERVDDHRNPDEHAPAEGGDPRDAARGGQAPRSGRADSGSVPEPSPEEVPELLGERSDYPIPWDDDQK